MSAPLSIPPFNDLPSAEDVVQISQWLKAAGLSSLELSNEQGTRLRICIDKTPEATPATILPTSQSPLSPPVPSQPSEGLVIKAPYFGNLLLHNPATHKAFAQEGSTVEAQETVAMLQIGELTVPITAPQSGTVTQLMAQEGNLINYGQTILTIQPN